MGGDISLPESEREGEKRELFDYRGRKYGLRLPPTLQISLWVENPRHVRLEAYLDHPNSCPLNSFFQRAGTAAAESKAGIPNPECEFSFTSGRGGEEGLSLSLQCPLQPIREWHCWSSKRGNLPFRS